VVRGQDGAFGFVGPGGEVVIEPSLFGARSFSEETAAVKIGSKWGYMDADGERVIEPAFEDARAFHDGRAAVRDRSGQWGFIDTTGQVVIPHAYDRVEDFDHGLALVTVGEEYGYIDTAGEWIYRPTN
jgi:hypothetical protein